ncbi:CaiB/BaiF CoA transferase family protein [Microbacterium sp. A93]|uniref:CaiB/BaiF CoA transferase family protein n=1 Tax=Microbacterium sp. A93 TaxID=3450716 RepID=UPI003F42E2E4
MRPLAGVRIADFTIHAAGPFATHVLAQLGAECIKIESAARPDIFRKPHAVYGRMEAATFDQVSSGKLSVRLNLKDRRGRDLARRIVGVSDIAAESFRPGVMDRLGLSYDDLRAVKQDIVMVSVSSSGQSGPDSVFAGYAPLFGAWSGLGTLTGHADGPPVEIRHVMDHSVGLNAATAVLAALIRRRRTGMGGHVDVAAREVAASLIGEALVEASAGIQTERLGNSSPALVPSGVYRCAGEDAWVAVAVSDDVRWAQLIELIGTPPAGLTGTSTLEARISHRIELDAWIETWTLQSTPDTSTAALQSRGIAAHPVWSTADVAADQHLRERGAVIEVAEPSGRVRQAVGVPIVFSETTDVGIHRGTPELGGDEDYVYGELLGLGRAERMRLEEEGVIS